ncbi:hypothetical protein CTP10_R47360 [Cupriavidus sp. P-10]|uniref:hypothetical protein n=1 Tax=Cupriavidus sp. P-10 TaxID=2027911 RepID=UPI0011C1031E|nr:hypothetical protein [Cupriavidus sp. P-10]BDB27331.1 hypothetical protein CTP10_R47360 [Cupriavidus sp. P-10]
MVKVVSDSRELNLQQLTEGKVEQLASRTKSQTERRDSEQKPLQMVLRYSRWWRQLCYKCPETLSWRGCGGNFRHESTSAGRRRRGNFRYKWHCKDIFDALLAFMGKKSSFRARLPQFAGTEFCSGSACLI